MRQHPPGASSPYGVEDGVEDLPDRVLAQSAAWLGGWQVRNEAVPLGVREVSGVRCTPHGSPRPLGAWSPGFRGGGLVLYRFGGAWQTP